MAPQCITGLEKKEPMYLSFLKMSQIRQLKSSPLSSLVTHLVAPVRLPEVADEVVRDVKTMCRHHGHLRMLLEELDVFLSDGAVRGEVEREKRQHAVQCGQNVVLDAR